jgi:thioredoxin-related protein
MNRDVLSDETLQDFIKEHCVFIQLNVETTQGARYKNYYPVESYPHFAIIEPFTGERVRSWKTKMEPYDFLFERKNSAMK